MSISKVKYSPQKPQGNGREVHLLFGLLPDLPLDAASIKGNISPGTLWHHLSLFLGYRPHTCWSSRLWFIHWGGKVESQRKNTRRLVTLWDMLWFSWNILLANKGNLPDVYHKVLNHWAFPQYQPFLLLPILMISLGRLANILQTTNM